MPWLATQGCYALSLRPQPRPYIAARRREQRLRCVERAQDPADLAPTVYAIGVGPRSVWQWWRAELGACLPAAVRELLSPHARIVSISMGETGTATVRETCLSLAGKPGPEQTRYSGSWSDFASRRHFSGNLRGNLRGYLRGRGGFVYI